MTAHQGQNWGGSGMVLLGASVLAGLGYGLFASWLTSPVARIALKGAGVGLLALALWLRAGPTGRPFAIVLALGALGDVAIEIDLVAGGVSFLAGHILATVLYRRLPRVPGKVPVPALLVGIPLLVFVLSGSTGAAFYGLGLAAMTASAWASRFPRRLVGLGALLFAMSDLLLFARMGAMGPHAWPGLLVWPSYYAGQLLIALGVGLGAGASADGSVRGE